MAKESLQPDVYCSIIISLVPAIVAVGLRFYPARVKKVAPWWDDYIAVFSLLPALAYDATAFWLLTKGLGLHLDDLPVPVEEAAYYQLLAQEIQEHTYTLAIGSAQLSLLALYWRLFSSSSTSGRMAILVLTALVTTWILVRLFVAVFQCFPPAYFWDKTLDGTCTVNPSTFFLVSVSTHLFIDIILIILPARQISRLNLPFVQKAAIGIMFMFGVTICVASIMMIITSVSYDSYAADFMWNCVGVVNWSAVEVHLSIMACCLPLLRPVMRDVGGWWGANFSSGKGGSNQSSSHRLKVVKHGHSKSLATSKSKSSRDKDSDSTRNLAIGGGSAGNRSNPDNIYGVWDESETYIVSHGMNDAESGGGRPRGKDIWVRYEADLSFSERDR